MLAFLIVAQIAAPSLPSKALTDVLESLEGIPECLTDGKTARIPKATRAALAAWNRHKQKILPALDAGAQARLTSLFANLNPHQALKAAESALDASDILAPLLPADRNSRLAAADRACMRAWIRVAGSRWGSIPDLEAIFQPFLDEGQPRLEGVRKEVKTSLAVFQTGLRARQSVDAKQALSHLLDLVDALEKPAP